MEHIKKEIRILLLCNGEEFDYERRILHHVVVPQLRLFCLNEYNIDFTLLDFSIDENGLKLPRLSTDSMLKVIKECQTMSNGPSCLIFAGEKCGGPGAPAVLRKEHYLDFLKQLKAKNNPSWMVMQKKYSLDAGGAQYVLQQAGLSAEEDEALLAAIKTATDLSVQAGAINRKDANALLQCDMERYVDVLVKDRDSRDHTICIIRQIKERLSCKEPLRSKVLDVNSQGAVDPEKNKKLLEIREKLVKYMYKDNCTQISVPISTLQSLSETSVLKAKARPMEQSSSPLTELQKADLSSEGYMHSFGHHLLDLLKKHINRYLQKSDFYTDKQFTEIEPHEALFEAIEEPAKLLDRDRELKVLDSYITSSAHTPGLLYGEHGTGKSLLLKLVLKRIPILLPRVKPVIIVRSAGKTSRSAILQLIIASISEQIASAFKKSTSRSCEYATCVYDFWQTLKLADPKSPIFILLDDVDCLYPTSHTELFRWLPHKLPPHVKVIMTTSSESILSAFKRRYDDSSAITVPSVDAGALLQLFPQMMKLRGKLADEKSLEAANQLLQQNSAPQYAQLLADALPAQEPEKLPDIIKLLSMKRIEQLETKYGIWLIKYVLSYLATSKFGLSFSELSDLLSLDNNLVRESGFDHRGSSIFRIPPNYLFRVFEDIKDYLMTMQIDERIIISFRHETFRNSIVEYYQLSKEFGAQIHQAHCEYWLNRYSGGKSKPLFDRSIDSEESAAINIDRCVPVLPYYWATESNKDRILCSIRRLVELPYHLLKADRISDLYKNVLFCFEYMYSKLMVSSVNDLIAEMYFVRQSYEVKNNQELEILIALLRVLAQSLNEDPEVLGPEIAGRSAHLVGQQPLFTMLHQQLDFSSPTVNCLLPTLPCYPVIDADEVRVELPKSEGKILCTLSPDNRFVATLSPSKEDILIIVWDSKSATKSQIINIGTHKDTTFIDLFYMPQRDEHIIVQYKTGDTVGFLFVNMDYAVIETTLSFPKSSNPKVIALAKSYLTLQLDGVPVAYSHPAGKKAQEFSNVAWPFMITPSDKYCVAPKPKGKSDTSKKPETNLRLINLSTGETSCVLTCPVAASYMAANVRNEILYVGCRTHGIIYRYDIGQVSKRDTKRMKPSLELNLEKQKLPDEIQNLVTRYLPMTSVQKITLSIDEKNLLVEYDLNEIRRFYAVWQLSSKSIQGVILSNSEDLVRLSSDGTYVYQYTPRKSGTTLKVYSVLSGNLIQESKVHTAIQHMYMMKGGSVFAVYPEEVLLTTSFKQMNKDSNRQSNESQNYCTALLKPEFNAELNILFSNDPDTSDFTYFNLDTNLLCSVDMSHSFTALTQFPKERYISADGKKLVLAYGSKHEEDKKRQRKDSVNTFIMDTSRQGRLIREQTDFRKPDVPGVNYFTGMFKYAPPSTSPKRINGDVIYGQKILRVFNLTAGKISSQISVTGEKVLQITDDYVLTFKPDYASLASNPTEAMDIVSVYDANTGVYIKSVYLEHPVIGCAFLDKGNKMMVCCGKTGKWLKLLSGKNFSQVEYQLDIETFMRMADEYARIVNIRGIHVFEHNHAAVFINYYWKDPEKEIYYAKIDLAKKEMYCQFSTLDFIQDVSLDGAFAIDCVLRLFELGKGDILRQLFTRGVTEDDPKEYIVRFTSDNGHIIALDNDRQCLSIIRNDNKGTIVGKASLRRIESNPESLEPFKMSIGQGGRIIILHNSVEFKVFVMRDCAAKTTTAKIVEPTYKNVIERSRYLMPHKRYNIFDTTVKKLGPTTANEQETEAGDKTKRVRTRTKKDTALSRESTMSPGPKKLEASIA